jgi:ABC-type transporter Mla subunit MlaD
MASVNDCINSGEAALNALYALQTAAMKAGNLAAQKALEDDIDELTYKLTQLRRQQIADNDAQINALNTQLGQVTTTAQAALNDLDELTAVLNDVVTASQILDGILGAAASA